MKAPVVIYNIAVISISRYLVKDVMIFDFDYCPALLYRVCNFDVGYFVHSGYKYEIIVIDDGSPDGTLEVAEQLQQIYGEDKIVSSPLVSGLAQGSKQYHLSRQETR